MDMEVRQGSGGEMDMEVRQGSGGEMDMEVTGKWR